MTDEEWLKTKTYQKMFNFHKHLMYNDPTVYNDPNRLKQIQDASKDFIEHLKELIKSHRRLKELNKFGIG